MEDTRWLILDTETSGIRSPIYTVEIGAQRMRGWRREGEPFHVLLNHDVPIEPQAEGIHGYSREYLRENGLSPREAHAQFRAYAEDLPVVAHNLSYDWNRVLAPEYESLKIAPAGRRGFCTLTLARRLISDIPSYSLDVLAHRFCPTKYVHHNALPDALLVVELFEIVYGPRLATAGLNTFEAIAQFSRKTPVAACLEFIRSKNGETAAPRRTPAAQILNAVIERSDPDALSRVVAGLRAEEAGRVNASLPTCVTMTTAEAQPAPAAPSTASGVQGNP